MRFNTNLTAQGRISASPNPGVDTDTIAIVVQATDRYGNNWSKTGLNVGLTVSGANSAVLTAVDQNDGTYRASYVATNAGSDIIRGTVGLAVIEYDTDGVSDGVYHEEIQESVIANHLEVTGVSSQQAGSSQLITIRAKGVLGNTSPSYRGIKTITLSGGLSSISGQVATCTDRNGIAVGMNTPMSVVFSAGVAQCNLYLYRAGAQSIDASDGSIDSTGNPDWDLDVEVSASSVHNASGHLTGSSTSVNTKDTVTATVYRRDQYGNNVSTSVS